MNTNKIKSAVKKISIFFLSRSYKRINAYSFPCFCLRCEKYRCSKFMSLTRDCRDGGREAGRADRSISLHLKYRWYRRNPSKLKRTLVSLDQFEFSTSLRRMKCLFTLNRETVVQAQNIRFRDELPTWNLAIPCVRVEEPIVSPHDGESESTERKRIPRRRSVCGAIRDQRAHRKFIDIFTV